MGLSLSSGFVFSNSLQAVNNEINEPPPDRGTPPTPYGTGSRGGCPSNTDLPPLAQLVGNTSLDLTVSERPSFWVYVPYTSSEVTAARFSFQEGDQEIYQATIQLPTTPGIIGMTAPETVPPLEVGTRYHWYFEIFCPQTETSDPSEISVPITLTGIVERVLPTEALTNELVDASSPLEKISAYVNHNIWYDALTELGQLRLHEPSQVGLIEEWEALLSDPEVGLEPWSKAPIIGESLLTSE
ncbi:MAG: DUF928 domain-containing protein [Cyanobacteria bacterium P01_F01_bin.86]